MATTVSSKEIAEATETTRAADQRLCQDIIGWHGDNFLSVELTSALEL